MQINDFEIEWSDVSPRSKRYPVRWKNFHLCRRVKWFDKSASKPESVIGTWEMYKDTRQRNGVAQMTGKTQIKS